MNNLSEAFSFLSFMSSFLLLYLIYYKLQKIFLVKIQKSEDGEIWIHSDNREYDYPPEKIIHRFYFEIGYEGLMRKRVYFLKDSWYFLSCFLSGFIAISILLFYYYLSIFVFL